MSEVPVASVAADLSERDAAILDFEASWWSASGVKEAEIRERFGLSALAHAPLLVKRLRRLRARRQEGRSRQLPVQVTV